MQAHNVAATALLEAPEEALPPQARLMDALAQAFVAQGAAEGDVMVEHGGGAHQINELYAKYLERQDDLSVAVQMGSWTETSSTWQPSFRPARPRLRS